MTGASAESPTNGIGRYYVLDLQRNFVRHQSVDPEDLGRQLKVLQPYEHLSEEN
jgi:hypothetical protein